MTASSLGNLSQIIAAVQQQAQGLAATPAAPDARLPLPNATPPATPAAPQPSDTGDLIYKTSKPDVPLDRTVAPDSAAPYPGAAGVDSGTPPNPVPSQAISSGPATGLLAPASSGLPSLGAAPPLLTSPSAATPKASPLSQALGRIR